MARSASPTARSTGPGRCPAAVTAASSPVPTARCSCPGIRRGTIADGASGTGPARTGRSCSRGSRRRAAARARTSSGLVRRREPGRVRLAGLEPALAVPPAHVPVPGGTLAAGHRARRRRRTPGLAGRRSVLSARNSGRTAAISFSSRPGRSLEVPGIRSIRAAHRLSSSSS